MLDQVTGSYGAPDEVAAIYREQEVTTQRALRIPPSRPRRSWPGRFFGVATDVHTWGALFYMLLALGTGTTYFVVTVVGLSLSAGLSVLIIGVPLIVFFVGTVRVMSLLEGRIVETMLGVRMPRRPPYESRDLPLVKRVGAMFSDPRTWTAMLYMLLMMPLGIVYFTVAASLLGVSLAALLAPLLMLPGALGLSDLFVGGQVTVDLGFGPHAPGLSDVLILFPVGVLLFFTTLHLLRGMGHLHGLLAKHLLVAKASR